MGVGGLRTLHNEELREILLLRSKQGRWGGRDMKQTWDI